jgi:hypothetical protein
MGVATPLWGDDFHQLTAFFTSAAIRASSAAVNSVGANATGHMAPPSRCAVSLKPNVAYPSLNFCRYHPFLVQPDLGAARGTRGHLGAGGRDQRGFMAVIMVLEPGQAWNPGEQTGPEAG